ncbi:MAG TPA: NAD(P)/FAD-dependent oxidoreductase [Anaerolineae bacterium]|nr:NAD(P)/FAD-dependent oxidoreductase [Anaerolineae bacterium]
MNATDGHGRNDKKRVLILGGGFGGLQTAVHLDKNLSKDAPVEVILVDQNHFHLFTPMLHEAASGVIQPGLIIAPIRRVLRKRRARFIRDRVDAIDLDAHRVRLRGGEIEYDILVVALGSVTNFYGIESVREGALQIKDADDADDVRCRVVESFEAATRETDPERRRELMTLVVVGAGCTGVEAVTEFHEFREHLLREQFPELDPHEMRTVLVEVQGRVLASFDEGLARSAHRRMERMGIDILLNHTVTGLSDRGLEFASDRPPLPAAVVVWAAGVAASPLVQDLPLEKDRMGRVVVGPDLAVPGWPGVYVMGDAAHARHPETNQVYPPTAQVAYRQAPIVAANIAADLNGGRHKQFDFTYIGDLVSLGKGSGVANPYGLKLRGLPAWIMWKFYYLLSLVGWQNRLRVALNWILALFFPKTSALSYECLEESDEERAPTGPGRKVDPIARSASERAFRSG